MADQFERLMGTAFSTTEARQFHLDDTPVFRRVHDTSSFMSDARIQLFEEAHELGYADDLFKVMEKTGLHKRYLSYLTSTALSYSDKSEE